MAYRVMVKVIGAGGTIWREMDIIEAAFKEAGFEVEITNEHPSELTSEQKEEIINRNNTWKVHLVAQHEPWGG